MSKSLVLRLRMPAASGSPWLARHEVARLLAEAGLDHLHDRAMLLTSELVTNGVVHARSEVELEVVTDAEGLQVTVADSPAAARDFDVAEVRAPDAQVREGGMGLALVSRLASRWGTDHGPGARAVWFRLDDAPQLEPTRTGRPGHGRVAGAPGDIDAVIRAIVGPDTHREPGQAQALPDLLERLAIGLGAETAAVNIDRGDGEGIQVLADYSSAQSAAPGGRTIRVPLRLSRPWTGELALYGVRGPHAESIGALIAGQFALLIENQRLEQAHNEGRGWLLFIAEAGELLAQSTSPRLTVALLPGLVVPRLGQWCAVHVVNEYGEMVLMAATHVDESAIPALSADLEKAALSMRTSDNAGPRRLSFNRDAMAFPLTIRGEHLGVLTVGRPANRPHTAEELTIISDLSRRAAVAIDNARTRRLL